MSSDNPVLASRIPAIEYHDSEYGSGLVQMTTAWFMDQLQWLSDNGFKTLTNAEMLAYVSGQERPQQKSCFLRFDMGVPVYKNFRDVIVPALQKFSFHATFFVLTNAIKDTSKDNSVCWSNLKEWEQTGLVEVGSHGVYHPDYRKAGTPSRLYDLGISKRTIETKLGHPISFFAFPYDSVPSHPDVLLKLFGYKLGFDGYRTERSVLFKDVDAFSLPCYYPYSSKKTYPLITATNKLTFGQMIEAAVAIPKKP
jgi:peptidoglycan/xylan/chitin deacetylase (PgdA/CDA1 family)